MNFNLSAQEIIPGAFRINDFKKEIEGKKIGVVANHSSIIINNGKSTHLVDSLISLDIDVRKIFSPEHGFKGDIDDGALIKDGKYRNTIDIISLYGSNKEMKVKDISDLDVLILIFKMLVLGTILIYQLFIMLWRPLQKLIKN